MKLTAQEVIKMKSVNIGAVSADMLPDVGDMAFDNSQSRKERMSSFLCHADNPYCFCVGGVGVKIEFADSTASAAKRVKESDGSVACIGSPNSAKIYDLDILCHDCGDDANNSTRFVIIEKTPNKTVTGHDKSSIVFAIDNKPGSLYSAIELLAKSGINMTKIESRPMKKELGKYVFFIDIDGNIDDASIYFALDKVRQNTFFYKFLGSYNY